MKYPSTRSLGEVNFNGTIDHILAREEGYVDHPDDRGGPTNYGITQATARAAGYTGSMRVLPLSLARDIYLKRYITGPKFDAIAQISEPIAAELIDTGVNMGPAAGVEMLQRWLNAFNLRGTKFPDVEVDGQIGVQTINALTAFVLWRGAEGVRVMVCALNCSQGNRYLEIAEGNPQQESFAYGWILNRVLKGASE